MRLGAFRQCTAWTMFFCVYGVADAHPASVSDQPPTATFPSRPIRMVIPLAPGGGSDIVGRVVAQALTDHWGQTVVVDNRPGAGSVVGTAIVAKAAADGYTMLVSSSSVAISPALYKKLGYDTLRDLAAVSLLASQPSILAVHHAAPFNSPGDLVAFAKAHPRQLAFGSAGAGSATHLGGVLLGFSTGIDLLHVPYKSAGLATAALMSGEVQVLLTNMASVLPHGRAGKLKTLAVTSARRSPTAPEIPTMIEAGYSGFEYSTWYGMLVPARTPPGKIEYLHAATKASLGKHKTRERLVRQGLDIHGTTPDSFQNYLAAEIHRWERIVKATGLAPQD